MFVFFVLLLPWIIVLIFQFVDPGNITQDNVDDYLKVYLNSRSNNSSINGQKNDDTDKDDSHFAKQENKLSSFDQILFQQQQQQIHLSKCAHLNIPTVPRSRFCPFSKKRIAKYDHYCPWVMQPIGERNIRFYLLFLLSNFLTITYFFVISEMFIMWQLKYSLKIDWNKHTLVENLLFSCLFLLKKEPTLCGILSVFFVFQSIFLALIFREIYLISKNLTLDEIMDKKRENQKNIINEYDKGILLNWIEVLFPEIL